MLFVESSPVKGFIAQSGRFAIVVIKYFALFGADRPARVFMAFADGAATVALTHSYYLIKYSLRYIIWQMLYCVTFYFEKAA